MAHVKKKTDLALRPLQDELGELLRVELLAWPGVTVRPMMGCMAFCRGKQMLGCYVNRDLSERKPWWMNRADEPTLAWVRLGKPDAERALKRPGVDTCRTGAANWIEIPLSSRKAFEEALRWFGVAYERPRRPKKRIRRA